MPFAQPYEIYPLGDSAIVLDFGNVIDEKINREVISIFHFISKNPIRGSIEALPAYSSLAIYYDVIAVKRISGKQSAFTWMKERLEEILENDFHPEMDESRLVRIPVCYDQEFGYDIGHITDKKNLPVEELARVHCGKTYRVFMLGFLPGFPYMGEVDERISMPRRATPRHVVPAGSVGIAGRQTGIYPLVSPGGWQIIGRTPEKMFDADGEQLTLLQAGDKVEFYPIGRDEFIERESSRSPSTIQKKTIPAGSNKLRIVKPGILDSFQDLGRHGYLHAGINTSGVMDQLSASITNFLVGNGRNEAVLEMHFPGPVIWFEKPAMIAMGGADFQPTINGETVPMHHAIIVGKNSILQFQRASRGAICYLAVQGGFELTPWLDSMSTHLKAGVGGLNGRALQKDDIIVLRSELYSATQEVPQGFHVMSWSADDRWTTFHDEKIMVVPGKEWEDLIPDSKEKFFSSPFEVSLASDRMGYRLKGPPLAPDQQKELVSGAVDFGTIQLLPDGQLILLMADHQTTGGYPRIAHVIRAHQGMVAQKKPGDRIHFELTSQETAEELLMKQHQHLHQVENACSFKLENSHMLH